MATLAETLVSFIDQLLAAEPPGAVTWPANLTRDQVAALLSAEQMRFTQGSYAIEMDPVTQAVRVVLTFDGESLPPVEPDPDA